MQFSSTFFNTSIPSLILLRFSWSLLTSVSSGFFQNFPQFISSIPSSSVTTLIPLFLYFIIMYYGFYFLQPSSPQFISTISFSFVTIFSFFCSLLQFISPITLSLRLPVSFVLLFELFHQFPCHLERLTCPISTFHNFFIICNYSFSIFFSSVTTFSSFRDVFHQFLYNF